jgi:hypothetical protein
MAIPRKSTQAEPSATTESKAVTSTSTPSKDLAGADTATTAKQAVSDAEAAATVVSAPATPPQPPQAVAVASIATTQLLPSQPQPAVAVTAPSTAPVADDDLPSILRRLTPIQRAKLRSAAISEGLIQQTGSGGVRENTDGSLTVSIRVDGDLVPQLKTWAEEAGMPIDQQIRDIVSMLLSSYLMSPWEPPQPVAAGGGEPVAK